MKIYENKSILVVFAVNNGDTGKYPKFESKMHSYTQSMHHMLEKLTENQMFRPDIHTCQHVDIVIMTDDSVLEFDGTADNTCDSRIVANAATIWDFCKTFGINVAWYHADGSVQYSDAIGRIQHEYAKCTSKEEKSELIHKFIAHKNALSYVLDGEKAYDITCCEYGDADDQGTCYEYTGKLGDITVDAYNSDASPWTDERVVLYKLLWTIDENADDAACAAAGML